MRAGFTMLSRSGWSTRTARPVTTLAAYVPLRYLLVMNVVVDGVTAIARGASGTLHVVRRIERFPPVGSLRYKVRTPYLVLDVPLGRLGKIVITDLREIALLPQAAVDKSNLVLAEFCNVIRG